MNRPVAEGISARNIFCLSSTLAQTKQEHAVMSVWPAVALGSTKETRAHSWRASVTLWWRQQSFTLWSAGTAASLLGMNRLIRRANILDFYFFFWCNMCNFDILFYFVLFCFILLYFLIFAAFNFVLSTFCYDQPNFPLVGLIKGHLILSYHTETPLKNNWLHFLHIFNNHTIQSNIYLHIYKYLNNTNAIINCTYLEIPWLNSTNLSALKQLLTTKKKREPKFRHRIYKTNNYKFWKVLILSNRGRSIFNPSSSIICQLNSIKTQ